MHGCAQVVNAGMLHGFAVLGPSVYDCLGQGGIIAGQTRYVRHSYATRKPVCSLLGDAPCLPAPALLSSCLSPVPFREARSRA